MTSLDDYLMQAKKWLVPSDSLRVGESQMILDLGCGDGEIVKILTSSGVKAIGLDSSPQKGFNFCRGDARSIPFKDGSFDVIIIILVLPHILEVHRVIFEMKRVLRNKGRILVVLFNKSLLNLPIFLAIRTGVMKISYECFKYYSIKDAKRLFQQAGFKVIRIYTTKFKLPLIGDLMVNFFNTHNSFFLKLPVLNSWGRLVVLEASLDKTSPPARSDTEQDEELLLGSIRRLDNWISRNGWAGYDPYGLSEKIYPVFGRNKGVGYIAKILRAVGDMTGITHIETLLKLLRVKQYLDPKTFAYSGKGYLLLYQMTGEGRYLRLARDCGDWLIADANKRGEAMWGHPFVFYSSLNNYFHKENNPNLLISSLAGHFLLDLYDETKEAQYRQMVEQTCEEILSIPYYIDAAGRICFWYIRDKQEIPIHNGNIYTASLLLRVGSYSEKEGSSSRLTAIAQGAIQYHLYHQNADGSWYYFAPPICNSKKMIDNRHTGFNLDAMKLCYDITPEAELRQGILKGANFYEKMFDHKGASFPSPTKKYPIIVHDLAQGIQTFSLLGGFSNNYLNLAKKIANYAIENMQNKDGSFSYARLNKFLSAKLPYMRYSQAPMFRALCELMSHLETEE